MSDFKVGIPLTFLLALAAGDPAAAAVKPGHAAESLTPGSLRNLLDRERLLNGEVRSNRDSAARMAQGCWFQYWRRC